MKKAELTAIKQAILMEIEGYEFYRMAQKNFDNPEVKDAFGTLMDEERMHADWLKTTYEHLNHSPDKSLDLSFLDTKPSAKIFDWKNLMHQSAQSPLAALGIALELEKSSMAHYKNLAQQADDANLERLFNVLATWEESHYKQFDELYQQLKDEWWSTQHYAPF
ncbi:MAG: ferritin family protein [Clostridia bacterium]|nr:ferritin family protein [Clostridia bacterium]